MLERQANRAKARRDAAFQQAGAKLDPVGPALLRGQKPVDAFNADFAEHATIGSGRHAELLERRRLAVRASK